MYGGIGASKWNQTTDHRTSKSRLAGMQDQLLDRVPKTTTDLHPDQPEGTSG